MTINNGIRLVKSGQILILVLLVVVVALAVGLSVASRNLTNLRTSTQTEQSQRAFSAAEGGVEDVLSRLTTIVAGSGAGCSGAGANQTCTVDVDPSQNIRATVNISAATNNYQNRVDLGSVAQVDVSNNGSATGNAVLVEWSDSTKSDESLAASVEITIVSENAGVYSQTRYYYNAGGVPATGSETPANAGDILSANSGCTASSPFTKCAQFSLPAYAEIVRIKPFWNNTTVRVSGVSSYAIPDQQYKIESVASTDTGVTRRVEVNRTKYQQVPAAFDYVLYSESSITK